MSLIKGSRYWLAPLIFVGSFAATTLLSGCQPASASYNSVLSTNNHHYDAQIVNQKGIGYALYNDGPYKTSRRTKTRDANGSSYRDDYVRVMQTKRTKTGSYVKLRYFNKYIGWMYLNGIKKVSFATVAKGTMAQNNFIGSAALISSGETTPTVVNSGYADASKKIDNSSDGTVAYPLASLQKGITGALVEQLISQGKLSPTTKLSKFYPEVPGSNQITVRQLLTMTSGITNAEQFPKSALTEQQSVKQAIDTMKVSNGTKFQYSDDDYVLLAGIISKVTGESYTDNVQSKIFDKVGMTNSYLIGSRTPTLSGTLAKAYTHSGNANYSQPELLSYPRSSAIIGAGNALTTPTDYTRFILGLQNGKILTKKQYQQLLSYSNTYSGGFYVNHKGEVFNSGSFSGINYHTGYYATTGNYHTAIVFSNQSPLTKDLSQRDFTYLMYRVATYY